MDLFSPTHLLVLLLIVLIIFGPSKLGDVGGALGKAIRDFKHAMNEPEADQKLAGSQSSASGAGAAAINEPGPAQKVAAAKTDGATADKPS
jgi:sec-independent protein translocase protein TatA